VKPSGKKAHEPQLRNNAIRFNVSLLPVEKPTGRLRYKFHFSPYTKKPFVKRFSIAENAPNKNKMSGEIVPEYRSG
jgi:hypothetical protein